MCPFEDNNKDLENNQNQETENITEDNRELKELELCKSDLQNIKDSFLRITADFDNYKKRIEKEKLGWIAASQTTVFLDILPIVDDFERAFSSYKKDENKELDKWMEGFELIYKSFLKLFEKYHVKEIKDLSEFNPEYHEAIAQVDSPQHKTGQIVVVVQKGYLIKDNVIRPAQVTVAK